MRAGKCTACTYGDGLIVKLCAEIDGVRGMCLGCLGNYCGMVVRVVWFGSGRPVGLDIFPALQVFWVMEYKEKRARSALLGLSVDALLLVGRVRQCLDPTAFFGRLCCYNKSVCNFGVWIGKISPD